MLVKHSIRKAGDLDKKKKAQATFKTLLSVVSIMFLFGLQWLFGAFTIAEASIVFQWLFVILSTLQGFFLFVFFCVLSQDAREEWLNLMSLGIRKKKKRGVITSHASGTTRRDRNTGSTYITTKYGHSNTLKKNVLSSVSSETSMEMTSRRALLLAPPISENKDTEFVISNGNTTLHDKNSDIDKVDLANGHLTNLDDVIGQPPSVEVPEHILEGRFMLRSNPAVAASPPLDRKEDTKDDKDDEDEDLTHLSQDSTTDCYDVSTTEFGDFTQLTDLSMLTNSDVSDNEELTRL